MRGRKLRSGSLLALVGALILVLGAAPSFGQPAQETAKDIADRRPDKGTRDYPHKANRVTIFFKKAIVVDDDDRRATITVEDSCERELSNDFTESKNTSGNDDFVGKAWVMLDRRTTNPKGLYYVTANYWLESDEEDPGDDPEVEDPPAPEARTYTYKFRVHGGPNCDGTGGGGNHPGHGGGGNNDKNRVWGNTSGDDHDHTDGHAGHENLRSPVTTSSTGSTHTDHTTGFGDYSGYTSPTLPSSDDDHTDHSTSSTTPFGEDDFGDPFGESTGNSPLSDPTDPSLYESEAGQIPEEAEDQQTLSAAPTDELGPESGTLVVALATALLLGVGGGLFLRRTDPAPIRPRS